jgi:hypothetical protein
MRWTPTENDREDVARLNADPWQIALLALNPAFTSWGPGEARDEDDIDASDNWDSTLSFDTWSKFAEEFGTVPDDLNEIVNFYFEVLRECEDCTACDASDLAPGAKALEDAFYTDTRDHKRWCDRITLDEAQALADHGRLLTDVVDEAYVKRVNQARPHHPVFGHDAINRGILIEARCARLGIMVFCDTCGGSVDCCQERHFRPVRTFSDSYLAACRPSSSRWSPTYYPSARLRPMSRTYNNQVRHG